VGFAETGTFMNIMEQGMKTLMITALLTIWIIDSSAAGIRRSVFLHHSTGGCIWGPNGSSTSVPQEVSRYNASHGFTGSDSVRMEQAGWPVNPWDNEWERWHRIFDNKDTLEADIRPYLNDYPIVVIKSCFPSSSISGIGSSSDTANPAGKTVANYKWHWRSIVEKMRSIPETFFVIWTNAPLVASQTNDQQALLSDAFCRWAKDTLANGLDYMFGQFPENVYVFDFFHKLAGQEGKLQPQYAASSGDSHPNAAATALVAPQFVKEVFDAAIQYEQVMSVRPGVSFSTGDYRLDQNFPNPFNPGTNIQFYLPRISKVTLKIYDMLGREMATLLNGEERQPGAHHIIFSAGHLASGTYIYCLKTEGRRLAMKFTVLR
jgi:hypothetical protein